MRRKSIVTPYFAICRPFLNNLVSKAAASKTDVNILVFRRSPSGDKVIKVALSLDGRCHSETVASQHAPAAPARLGSNDNPGDGTGPLLSPRGMPGGAPEAIRSPRVPLLPLANMTCENGGKSQTAMTLTISLIGCICLNLGPLVVSGLWSDRFSSPQAPQGLSILRLVQLGALPMLNTTSAMDLDLLEITTF